MAYVARHLFHQSKVTFFTFFLNHSVERQIGSVSVGSFHWHASQKVYNQTEKSSYFIHGSPAKSTGRQHGTLKIFTNHTIEIIGMQPRMPLLPIGLVK